MFGYMMNVSDDVIENMLTHKVVKGGIPEAELDIKHEDIDLIYDGSEDIDMGLLRGYLTKEASKDET